ncbi:Alkaline phosphatase synthesis sensor protein PhoR [compost metagenome]
MPTTVPLSVLLERLPDPAIVVARPDGAIAGWNEAASRLWGQSRAEAARAGLAALVGQAASARLLRATPEVWANERLEFVVRRADGMAAELLATVTPLDDAGGALLLVVRDISAERGLARQLQETQRVAQVGCWELTLPGWRFSGSDQLYRLYGINPREGAGNAELVFAAIHPDDRDRALAAYCEAGGRLGAMSVQFRVCVGDETRVVYCRAEVLPGEDGRPARMVGTTQDITERVAAETALQEQYERLWALDRMKDHFISMVSHELRTPLTSIKGYAEFLEDEIDGELADGHRSFVAGIQANTVRLQRLVDDLLEVARHRAGELEVAAKPVDVHEAIARAVDAFLAPAAESGVCLVTRPDAAAPAVLADPYRLEQVLLHVLDNAVKFTPAGGTVAIAHRADETGCWIEVADDGPGVPAGAIDQIFEPFFQVDGSLTRRHSGTGLGLYVARTILEAMNGTIEVLNRPEGGALFRLRLPKAA